MDSEREFVVDNDFINLFMNGIYNDFAKMSCATIIFSNQSKISNFDIELLMQYAIVYEEEYFARRFFSVYKRGLFSFDEVVFLYLDYTKDENVFEELKNKYTNKKTEKKEKRDIEKESDLKDYKKELYKRIKELKNNNQYDEDIKMGAINRARLELISYISKYKFLCKLYNIEENKDVDRLYNWNIKQVKKHNTVKDRLHLM